jgi:hypothetical protein
MHWTAVTELSCLVLIFLQQDLDIEMRSLFHKLRSLHMHLKPILFLWHILQFSDKCKQSVSLSKVVPDNPDGPSRSNYSADSEACQDPEISPVEVAKLYNPAQEDSTSFQQEKMDAFRTPVMKLCRQALYGVCLRSTLFPGGQLDFQASRVYNAVLYTSAASVWFTR